MTLASLGDDAACTLVDAYLERGHNFVDTANTYANGESERIIGKAIRGHRDDVILATKGRVSQGPGANDSGSSRIHLTRALDASLRRLGTDHVDLYQCHSWDPGTPIEETMETLDGFVRAGKVRYVGGSNFTGSQIVEAQWAASRLRGVQLISLQTRYALISRDGEADVLPTCERHGLGVLAYSPLGGGFLTGRYQAGQPAPPDARYAPTTPTQPRPDPTAREIQLSQRAARVREMTINPRNFAIVDEVRRVAAELGATPVAVSLAWLLTRAPMTSLIIGPRNRDQLDENLACLDLQLPDDAVDRLDAVSRPPATWQSLVTGQLAPITNSAVAPTRSGWAWR